MKTLIRTISNDAECTLTWYESNYLEANPDKFQCVFMDRKGRVDTSVPISNVSIDSSPEIKILGITLDSELNFKSYIKSICYRASNQINAMKRIGKYLDSNGR